MRTRLSRRDIRAVVPQPANEIATCKRRGRSDGRPPGLRPRGLNAAQASSSRTPHRRHLHLDSDMIRRKRPGTGVRQDHAEHRAPGRPRTQKPPREANPSKVPHLSLAITRVSPTPSTHLDHKTPTWANGPPWTTWKPRVTFDNPCHGVPRLPWHRTPRSGPAADQLGFTGGDAAHVRSSEASTAVDQKQTKSLLVSYSPRKPGFFHDSPPRCLIRRRDPSLLAAGSYCRSFRGLADTGGKRRSLKTCQIQVGRGWPYRSRYTRTHHHLSDPLSLRGFRFPQSRRPAVGAGSSSRHDIEQHVVDRRERGVVGPPSRLRRRTAHPRRERRAQLRDVRTRRPRPPHTPNQAISQITEP